MRPPPAYLVFFPAVFAIWFATREYRRIAYVTAEKFIDRHRERWFPRKEYRIVVIGNQGAGKTSVCQKWTGAAEIFESTNGFSVKSVSIGRGKTIHLFDLGGGEHIQPYWNRYFEGSSAIVFVVDSKSDENSFQEIIEMLCQHIAYEAAQQIPLLVLVNKCDSPGDVASAARHAPIITDALRTSKFQGMWRIFYSSAKSRNGDGNMRESLAWLTSAIGA